MRRECNPPYKRVRTRNSFGLWLFEIALVLVGFKHIANRINGHGYSCSLALSTAWNTLAQ